MSSNGVSPADPTLAQQVTALEQDWAENPRWKGIERTYTAEDVVKLRPSIMPDVTLAKHGADRLFEHLARSSVRRGERGGVFDEISQVTVLFLADRSFERDGLLGDLDYLPNLLRHYPHLLGYLFGCGLPALLLQQPP